MVVTIKADFDSFDLAELCANKVRRAIHGSKSIKIVSGNRCSVKNIPAVYSFSARSENYASTPLSILNSARLYENLSTLPCGLVDRYSNLKSIRLEIICNKEQLNDVYKIMLSNGGNNIRR